MKDSTRYRLERLLVLTRRPAFILSTIAFNLSTAAIMLWFSPSTLTCTLALGCMGLVALDVRHLMKVRGR